MKNELLDFRITKTVSNGYTRFRIQKMIDRTKINVTGKTKKEVTEKFYKKLEELDNNSKALDFDLNNITFADFTKYYLYDVVEPAGSIKGSTFKNYSNFYNVHIKNSNLNKVKLVDTKTKALQDFYNELANKNLQQSTIKIIFKFTSTVLNYANKNDYISKNYIGNVLTQKQEENKEKHKFLTSDEINMLLNTCENKTLKMVIYLILQTGLRINEALALTIGDVNNNVVDVNKNIQHTRTEYIVSSPKTKTSIRKIPINSNLQNELNLYILFQREDKLKLGIILTDETFLFTNNKNNFYDSKTLTKNINKLYKKCEINTSGFHALRHTFGSILYENGVDIKTISELLGHSNINVTSQIYIHLSKNKKHDAVKVFNF